MTKEELLYDLRVIDVNIKQGKITKKNYEGFIKKLPNVEDKSQILIIEQEEEMQET